MYTHFHSLAKKPVVVRVHLNMETKLLLVGYCFIADGQYDVFNLDFIMFPFCNLFHGGPNNSQAINDFLLSFFNCISLFIQPIILI